MVGNMSKLETFFTTIKEMGVIINNKKSDENILYLALPSIKNVKWIMPLNEKKDKKISFLLYQPSTIKAKLLKNMFINTPNLILKNIFRKNIIYLNTNNFLNEIKKQEDIYNYSFFLGTDGFDCKPTIQISNSREPLMYLKVTSKKNVKNLFNNEEKILKSLNSTVIKDRCPSVVINQYYGKLNIFASSTTKTIKSKYIKELTNEHVDFLAQLYFSTKKQLFSQASSYFINTQERISNYLKINLDDFWIADIFNQVGIKLANSKIYECINHRDFTMWNCYFNDKKIFVFDWEYANRDGLPFFDILHFIIKRNILDEVSEEKIYKLITNNNMIKKYANEINVSIEHLNDFIILYLIDVILLDDFKIDISSNEQLKVKYNRIKLLKYVLELRL